MNWNKLPTANDYISFLQEQGHTNFDPIAIRKDSEMLPTVKVKSTSKAADRIKEQNALRLEQKLISDELKVLDNIKTKFKGIWDIQQLKTILLGLKREESRVSLLRYILDELVKKGKASEKLYHVYYSLKLMGQEDELLRKAEIIIEKQCNLITIQMTMLSSFLYPLNILNLEKPKLDDWQLDIFKKIDDRANILIVARTSSGKTVCSTYAVFTSRKSIFLVPSDELARQVAGVLRNLLKGQVALMANKDSFMDNDNFKVLVGTPLKVEDYLVKNGISGYDYLICDEVHQIRDQEREGYAYERIISLIPPETRLLMMSATISNANDILRWIETLKESPVELVTYNRRFITQQRHIWNGSEMVQLSPFSVVSIDDLCSRQLDANLTMTACDLYKAYETMCKISKDRGILDKFDPRKFFKTKIITLNDVREFESHFKQSLFDLSDANPQLASTFLQQFRMSQDANDKNDIVKLLQVLKAKDMTPAIIFRNSTHECVEMYCSLIMELERQEREKYPHYYNDLRLHEEAYKSYLADLSKLDNADKKNLPPGYTSFASYRMEAEANLMNKNLKEFKAKFETLYNSRITKISESDMDEDTKAQYIADYMKELNKVKVLEVLGSVDVYRPHPEFTFTQTINSDQMRRLKRRLLNNLDQKINYEHIFLRGIERGVVIYHSELQPPFQREVQSLINQKKIDIIIADESLAYGVNMPIKTVVLHGTVGETQSWDVVKATQMIGRSGRRGIDREGHIVFYNVNWVDISKSKMSAVCGVRTCTLNDVLPLSFSRLEKTDIVRSLGPTFNDFLAGQHVVPESRYENLSMLLDYVPKASHHKIWQCRKLGDKALFIPELVDKIESIADKMELFREIYKFMFKEDDKDVIKSIQENRLCTTLDKVLHLKDLGELLIVLHSEAESSRLKKKIETMFDMIKVLLIKSQWLE